MGEGGVDVITVGETMGCFLLRDHSEAGELTFIGAESNVAIGLASLGHRALWVSRLGSDQVGDYIVECLRGCGVDLHVTRDPTRQTGLALKELRPDRTAVRYYRKDSAASAMTMRDVPPLAGAEWLHVTGITPALSASCAELVPALMELAASRGVQVSLDINLRRPLWGTLSAARDSARRLCGLAQLVFVGQDESSVLRLGDTLEEFVQEVALGPDAVVVFKHGPQGARASAAGVTYHSPAAPADIVDVTGAGDAFAAGFLSGLLRRLPTEQCLRLGSVMAAQVIGTDQDFAGPPDEGAVERVTRHALR